MLFILAWHLPAQELIVLDQIAYYQKGTKLDLIRQRDLLPRNIPGRQEILEVEYSIEPSQVLEKDGDKYVYFEKQKKEEDLIINIRTTILMYSYGFAHAKKQKKSLELKQDHSEFLRQEENFQVDHKRIQAIADNIRGKNEEEIVREIFEFVVGHMDYHIFETQDRGAKKALKEGRGDCTEYSELMVTLCRAKGIPARIVLGLVAPYKTDVNPLHNWVEVYFEEYGWVPFDPTHADCLEPNCPANFDRMENYYVYYSYGRFDKINQSNIHYSPTSWMKSGYVFRAENFLEKKLLRAKNKWEQNDFDHALSIVDTVLDMGFKRTDFFSLKSKILSRKKNLEKARKTLQYAGKYAETNNDKEDFLFALAIWHAENKDAKNVLFNLNKWVAYKEDKFGALEMINGETSFGFMRQDHEFGEICRMTGDAYLKLIKNIDQLDFFSMYDHLNLLKPDLMMVENSWNIIHKYFKNIAKENKIKKISCRENQNEIGYYEFDREGHLLCHQENDLITSYTYKKINEETKLVSLKKGKNKSLIIDSYYFNYDDNSRLIGVKHGKENCEKNRAKVLYKINMDFSSGHFEISEIDDYGDLRKKILFEVDRENRLAKINCPLYADRVKMEWQYLETKNKCEKWLSTKDTSFLLLSARSDKNGRFTYIEHEAEQGKIINEMKYNDLGRLKKASFLNVENGNQEKLYIDYFYDKKGMLKKKITTSRLPANNYMIPLKQTHQYIYEFWE